MIKFRLFFHPHFLIKYYLFRDIREICQKYHFDGDILDVGCGVKPYRKLFNEAKSYKGIDFENYSNNKEFSFYKPDWYFGNQYKKTGRLPFRTNAFDHTVSFQVLEHHPKPSKFIEEIVRVTRHKGTILLSAPFIGGLHEEPNDFFRFSEYALRELLENNSCQILVIKKEGSLFSTLITLTMDGLMEFMRKERMFYFLGLLIYPFLLILSYVCLLIDQLFRSEKVFLNYTVLARKI